MQPLQDIFFESNHHIFVLDDKAALRESVPNCQSIRCRTAVHSYGNGASFCQTKIESDISCKRTQRDLEPIKLVLFPSHPLLPKMTRPTARRRHSHHYDYLH